MFIVQVNTNNVNDGCFNEIFAELNDEVRAFIKEKAESFRKTARNPSLKCVATIMRNGTSLDQARIIEC